LRERGVFCTHTHTQHPYSQTLLRSDVLAFLKGETPKAAAKAEAPKAAPAPAGSAKAAAPASAGLTSRRIVRGRGQIGGAAAASPYTDIPASNVRKVIASRLAESKVGKRVWLPCLRLWLTLFHLL
jgi:pyruvate/2-oxoglutarate dehydrogenase complex dihydrolipoamide acyltransferase (E2) component